MPAKMPNPNDRLQKPSLAEVLEERRMFSGGFGPDKSIQSDRFWRASHGVVVGRHAGAKAGLAVKLSAGDWVSYRIEVPDGAEFEFQMRMSPSSDIALTVDGTSLAPPPPASYAPVVKGWAVWGGGGIRLESGVHVLRVRNQSPAQAHPSWLDWLRFRRGPLNLDQTFGTGGIIQPVGEVLGVRPDGEYITSTTVDGEPQLVLHHVDGSVDGEFGKKSLPLTGFDDFVTLPSGKYLMGDGEGLLRFNADGTLDHSFGEDGTLATTGPSAIQPGDGKILVAELDGAAVELKRYLPDGRLDDTFESSEAQRVELDHAVPKPPDFLKQPPTSIHYGIGMGIRADGDIVVGFDARANTSNSPYRSPEDDYFIFVRFKADGAVDTDFGQGGVAVQKYDYESGQAVKMALLPNGNIVAMQTDQGTYIEIFDGQTGASIAGTAAGWDPGDFAVGPDGKVVTVGGGWYDKAWIGRAGPIYGWSGFQATFDPYFSLVLPDVLNVRFSTLNRVAVQQDGKILAIGRVEGAEYLFRFEGDSQ